MENELVGKYTMPGLGFGTLGNVGDAGSALVEAALAEGYNPKHGPAWDPA